MSYYGARSDFRHNYKLPYRSVSYAVFKPCTTLYNREGNNNTVRCRSNVRVRSYRTYSNYQPPFKYKSPRNVLSQYRTNSVGSRGYEVYSRDYSTGRRPAVVTPCTTRYRRLGRKAHAHCSDSSVARDSHSSATVIAKDPYTTILAEESHHSAIVKPRAVSYENKLTQTKGSDIDRALGKTVESAHNTSSGVNNRGSRMNRKTTTSKLKTNGEYRRKAISKMNTNVDSRLTRVGSSGSVRTRVGSSGSVSLEGDITRENIRDDKPWDIAKPNNKQRERSKKNLFVRFMNFGQQWSKQSNHGEMGSPIASKKKLRERRESGKKPSNKMTQKSISTQSTPPTSEKTSHNWKNKTYHVSTVSIENGNNEDDDDDTIEFIYDGNRKNLREERKIYYDEDGRRIYDDEGKKINYDKHKDDTAESSKNNSRLRKQSKENKGNGVNYDDTGEKTDKTDDFFNERSSPRNIAERRPSHRRASRRESKNIKDNPYKRTHSNRTNVSERPENNPSNTRKDTARNKKDRWTQPSPTGSNYTITSRTRIEYKGQDGVKRLLSSSMTKTCLGRCKTCTSRRNSSNKRDDPSVTFVTTTKTMGTPSNGRHERQTQMSKQVEDLKQRITRLSKSRHNYTRQWSVDSKVGDYRVEQKRVMYQTDDKTGGKWNNLEERYKRIRQRNNIYSNPEPLPICRISSVPKHLYPKEQTLPEPKTWLKIPPRKSPLSQQHNRKEQADECLPILRIRI